MATHSIDLGPSTLRGYFSRDVTPAVTIDSGDTVRCQTLDAGWGALRQADPFASPVSFQPRDTARDFAQTLGGRVHKCWIEGRIQKFQGDLDGQTLIVVPIKILVP